MGRKKKQTNAVQTIGYQGTVKISVMDGKRVVSTQEYHNTGYKNLFKYLCYALQGSIVSTLRPNKIVLYNDTTFAKTAIVSPAVMIDSEPVVNISGADCTCTLHFRVPYAYITSGTTSIKAVAIVNNIFDPEYSTYTDELCASFILANEIPIDSTKTGNYSIVVEWTMTIKNA